MYRLAKLAVLGSFLWAGFAEAKTIETSHVGGWEIAAYADDNGDLSGNSISSRTNGTSIAAIATP
jgi:hypothetical protein